MKGKTNQTSDRSSEIYSKALDLFMKKGFDATSMSMIADALKMSKANLYYYCSSKENLLYQIHLDNLKKHFIPILDEAERLPDPKDRITHFLRQFTLFNTLSPVNRVLVHELPRLAKNHRKEIELIWRRAYEIVRDSMRELQKSGRVRKFKESFLTFMWVGMVFWVVYWFDYGRQTNAKELSEAIVQTFLDSLLPESPSGSKNTEKMGEENHSQTLKN